MSLLRRSVLITGCSDGGIFATVRNPSKISQGLSKASNVTVLTLDVVSSQSITAAVESVTKEMGGKLDVLVNNSGGNLLLPALDVSIDEGKKLIDLNFLAPFAMVQAFAPLLIEAKGCIVNNPSANAYAPMPIMSVYNASKAALAAASETWRHEMQPLGVRTITLITCAVKTKGFDEYKAPELPVASRYTGIRDFIYSLSDGHLQDNAISARQYALEVVREVKEGSVGTVWVGTDAFFARLGSAILPQSVFDIIVQSIVPISKEMAKVVQKK